MWFVKQFLHTANFANRQIVQCIVQGSNITKEPEACNRPSEIEKPSLDPDDLKSYKLISNLSFNSKTIKRVVALWFSEHAKTPATTKMSNSLSSISFNEVNSNSHQK